MRKGSLEITDRRNTNKNNEEVVRNEITKKNIVFMFLWLIIAAFVFYEVYNLMLYTIGKKEKSELFLYTKLLDVFENGVSIGTVSEDYTLKFAGLGDIYFTANTISGATTASGYDFVTGTEKVQEKLKEFDIVTSSLKTPIAGKTLGYSYLNTYNAPDSVTKMLKAFNITCVATATSHAVDKNIIGINNTIDTLSQEDIKVVGISKDKRNSPVIMQKNNISIGILSYTTESNVKLSAKNKYALNIFDEDDLKEDMKYLKDNDVDFVVVYLNVPNENASMVNTDQKQITEKLFENGVDVVLGSGCMVIQEDLEEIGDNNKKIYTIYSLGDVCGSFKTDDNTLSVIANIEFKKQVIKDSAGNVKKTNLSFNVNKPIALWTVVNTNYSTNLYILNDEIENYNKGKSKLSSKEYLLMKEAQNKVEKLYGNNEGD